MAAFVTEFILGPLSLDGENTMDIKPETRREQAAKAIDFFVQVQAELLSPKNGVVDISSAAAIEAGLERFAITRLEQTKTLLLPKTQAARKDFKALS